MDVGRNDGESNNMENNINSNREILIVCSPESRRHLQSSKSGLKPTACG